MLIRREEVHQPMLPSGAYKYKIKNGKTIYKNKFLSEYYIVYPIGNGKFVVEQYKGECRC